MFAVFEYAMKAKQFGANKTFVDSILKIGSNMLKWQNKNLTKRPDLPKRIRNSK